MSTSSVEDSASPSPVAPNAPKFGTLIPNRIFVGGISPSTTESELQALFSNYGRVKATKIIQDRAGVSKGYGFVTFESEEEARRIQKEADIILRDRKLNIAPAIKKQPFARGYDSPPVVSSDAAILYQNGIPYTYHNGMAFFSVPEGICTYGSPQANYPVIYPSSSVYVPQQPFPCPNAAAAAVTASVGSSAQSSPYGNYPSTTSLSDLAAQYVPFPVPTQYFIPDQNY